MKTKSTFYSILTVTTFLLCWFGGFQFGRAYQQHFHGASPAPTHQGSGAVSPSRQRASGPIYPSIVELQEWCGAEPDGIWGPETDHKYRVKQAKQYGDECALSLWPEVK